MTSHLHSLVLEKIPAHKGFNMKDPIYMNYVKVSRIREDQTHLGFHFSGYHAIGVPCNRGAMQSGCHAIF